MNFCTLYHIKNLLSRLYSNFIIIIINLAFYVVHNVISIIVTLYSALVDLSVNYALELVIEIHIESF